MNKTANKQITDRSLLNGEDFLKWFTKNLEKYEFVKNVKNLRIIATIEEYCPQANFCFINGKLKFTYKYDNENCNFTLEYKYDQTPYNNTQPNISINCLNYDVNAFGLNMTDYFENNVEYDDVLEMIRKYASKL